MKSLVITESSFISKLIDTITENDHVSIFDKNIEFNLYSNIFFDCIDLNSALNLIDILNNSNLEPNIIFLNARDESMYIISKKYVKFHFFNNDFMKKDIIDLIQDINKKEQIKLIHDINNTITLFQSHSIKIKKKGLLYNDEELVELSKGINNNILKLSKQLKNLYKKI